MINFSGFIILIKMRGDVSLVISTSIIQSRLYTIWRLRIIQLFHTFSCLIILIFVPEFLFVIFELHMNYIFLFFSCIVLVFFFLLLHIFFRIWVRSISWLAFIWHYWNYFFFVKKYSVHYSVLLMHWIYCLYYIEIYRYIEISIIWNYHSWLRIVTTSVMFFLCSFCLRQEWLSKTELQLW